VVENSVRHLTSPCSRRRPGAGHRMAKLPRSRCPGEAASPAGGSAQVPDLLEIRRGFRSSDPADFPEPLRRVGYTCRICRISVGPNRTASSRSSCRADRAGFGLCHTFLEDAIRRCNMLQGSKQQRHPRLMQQPRRRVLRCRETACRVALPGPSCNDRLQRMEDNGPALVNSH